MNRLKTLFILTFLLLTFGLFSAARAEVLKPFVLGKTPSSFKNFLKDPGSMADVVEHTKAQLTEQGFTVVGSYSPYPNATVICASHPDISTAAAKAKNGGFGAAQRVAITEMDGKLQVSYMNPAYLGIAYGLGKLESVSEKLTAALGHELEFGAEGINEEKLGPGKYHYKVLMPYFDDVDVLNTYPDYQTGVQTVEANLAAGKGGTVKVYRIDLPDKDVSVFGIGIIKGDGPDSGDKDTDKEVMDIIDYQEIRSTAYLPYELMVQGNQAIALRGRYRIAVHFPDTSMAGQHGFTKIMSSPGGIKKALEAVAGK
ncbi:MAG: hypothetical protein AMK70_00260 [Nitrospira bacterium SG8_35_1]|nr:MAG: hypothetical protein AMK70_00260 [Nitrospira bacterium SG8_35_1]